MWVYNGGKWLYLIYFWGLSDWRCLRFTALWLCLCAGATEVKFLVCSPGPSLHRLASGCSHDPLASPAPSPKISWKLAWLLLLTAHPTFFVCALHSHAGFHGHLCSLNWGTMCYDFQKQPSVRFDFMFKYVLSCYFPSFPVCCLGETEHSLCCAHLWHCSLMSCAQNSSHTCLNNLWIIRIWFYCVFFELHNARFIASFLCYILPYLCWVFFVCVPPCCVSSYFFLFCSFNSSLYSLVFVSVVLNFSDLL